MIILIFKLATALIFLMFVLFILKVGRRMWMEAEEADVKEKKNDIENRAKLVDDVNAYTKGNKKKIEKSESDVVDKFVR